MNEKLKIDLRGSVSDAVSETITDFSGFAIFMAFVGCLIAPIFAPLFRGSLYAKYDINHHYDRIPLVESKMRVIKLGLWIVAALGWGFVIACNLLQASPRL